LSDINFLEYKVEYGTNAKENFDITAKDNVGNLKLIGEAFNVSEKFFQVKKNKSLAKFKKNEEKLNPDIIKILMYNYDAVKDNDKIKCEKNEYHIRVKIGTNFAGVESE
jgi:hypothetical protein